MLRISAGLPMVVPVPDQTTPPPEHSDLIDERRRVDLAMRSDPGLSIADLLVPGTKPTFSFEFFPPRDGESAARLQRTIADLEPLQPDFVSVTYGANGSSRERTIAATRDIARHTPFRIMGHLTCTGQTVDEIKAAIDSYADVGITHIMAIRGDMPGGPGVPWEPVSGGLRNATELVELVASRGSFCIGVAAFPDIHPSGSPELDAQILADKALAGASFAITQLFFEPERMDALVARVRALGCAMPIIGGIMPVTAINQLAKFAELSGADLPAQMTTRLQAVADDPAAVRREGLSIATEVCVALLRRGVPGLQFFTQNQSKATREILAMLQELRW